MAEFVDDQQLVGSELFLQTQKPLLVARFKKFVNQCRGGDEADGYSFLAGGQAQSNGDVRLAGAAIARRDHILPSRHIVGAGEIKDQCLVQGWQGLEVEAVQAFDRREAGRLDPPFNQPPFPVDQFQFRQALQIAGVIDALGGALTRQLVIFAQEGRQLERLQMMTRSFSSTLTMRQSPRRSSMARYGKNEVPFLESYRPNPEDPYGFGKVTAEDILRNLCHVHGIEYVIAVPHNIIGPRQKYDAAKQTADCLW